MLKENVPWAKKAQGSNLVEKEKALVLFDATKENVSELKSDGLGKMTFSQHQLDQTTSSDATDGWFNFKPFVDEDSDKAMIAKEEGTQHNALELSNVDRNLGDKCDECAPMMSKNEPQIDVNFMSAFKYMVDKLFEFAHRKK